MTENWVRASMRSLGIIAVEILLFASFCSYQPVHRSTLPIEQYWTETGLSGADIEYVLKNENCYHSAENFLGCVNAINSVAEKYDLRLSENGSLVELSVDQKKLRGSEKQVLSAWLKVFDQSELSGYEFVQKWKDLKAKHISPADMASVVAMGLNAYLSVTKDPHSYIVPLRYYEEVVANTQARQVNLGMVTRPLNGELIVKKVIPQSPAFQAGLRKGDRITEVNGKRVSDYLSAQLSEAFRLNRSHRLLLSAKREEQSFHVELFRQETVVPTVSSDWLNSNRRVGVITIHRFAKDTCANVRSKLVEKMEMAVQGIILDLRDNPGGQVEEAACVANLFLQKDVLMFETRYLDPHIRSDRYMAKQEQLYRGPVAVLINSGSASAAEIVAGVLKDQGRATLVGERTFGKGSFQDGRVWSKNSKIAVFQTEGLYYFASGWTPQLVGIQPDIEVAYNNIENQREEDLYFRPILPTDAWGGPQSISWLLERQCESLGLPTFRSGGMNMADDTQLQRAEAWLSCGGANDRNVTL